MSKTRVLRGPEPRSRRRPGVGQTVTLGGRPGHRGGCAAFLTHTHSTPGALPVGTAPDVPGCCAASPEERNHPPGHHGARLPRVPKRQGQRRHGYLQGKRWLCHRKVCCPAARQGSAATQTRLPTRPGDPGRLREPETSPPLRRPDSGEPASAPGPSAPPGVSEPGSACGSKDRQRQEQAREGGLQAGAGDGLAPHSQAGLAAS